MKGMVMEQRPAQPPEGKLIAAAQERSGQSIRKAAEQAGISYGRWRQIASGVQHVSPGNYAAVHAPAKTVARMAAVVGITAEQLETEGQRPDAAEALREMRKAEPAEAQAPATSATPFREPLFGALSAAERIDAMGEYEVINTQLARLSRDQGIGPAQATGDALFPTDPLRGVAWNAAKRALESLIGLNLGLTWDDVSWAAARGIRAGSQDGESRNHRRGGVRGA